LDFDFGFAAAPNDFFTIFISAFAAFTILEAAFLTTFTAFAAGVFFAGFAVFVAT
jgi:hypothetical protein